MPFFFLQHCAGSPPPSAHLLLHPSPFLSGCAHTPRRHLVSHYSLGSFLPECQRRLSSFSHLITFFFSLSLSFSFATFSNFVYLLWPGFSNTHTHTKLSSFNALSSGFSLPRIYAGSLKGGRGERNTGRKEAGGLNVGRGGRQNYPHIASFFHNII